MIVTFKTIPSRINTIENVIKHYESYNFVIKIIIKIDNFNKLEQKKAHTPLFLKKYKNVVIQNFDIDLGPIQKYFVSQSNVNGFIFICDDDAMVDLNFVNKFNFNKNYLYLNRNITYKRSLSADGINFKKNSQSIKYVSTDFKKISI